MCRNPGELFDMKERFIDGVVQNSMGPLASTTVFRMVSGHFGYGFCHSNAVTLMRTVYQPASLKTHHAAARLTGLPERHPGMHDVPTMEQEARRTGVRMLRACIQRFEAPYASERVERGALCIRRPLRAVTGITPVDGAVIVRSCLTDGPFFSAEDCCSHIVLENNQLRALAASSLLGDAAGNRRMAVRESGVLPHRRSRRPLPTFRACNPLTKTPCRCCRR